MLTLALIFNINLTIIIYFNLFINNDNINKQLTSKTGSRCH